MKITQNIAFTPVNIQLENLQEFQLFDNMLYALRFNLLPTMDVKEFMKELDNKLQKINKNGEIVL